MIEYRGKHYLYRHIRLDKNEPFYIGIGTKLNKHNTLKGTCVRAFCKFDRGDIWKKISKKTGYKIEIIMESKNYEFIKQKEIEFIKVYGRKNLGTGILANLTDGGDGTIGIEFSQERKDKISKANKGNKFALGSIRSEEFRKNIGLRVSKFFQNKENRERFRKMRSVPIVSENNTTKEIIFHESTKKASKELNVTEKCIYLFLKNKSTFGKGYKFFYKEAFENNGILNLNINYE